MASQPILKLTEQEYLQRERLAEQRSEYVDGEVFAMAGGSPLHSELASSVGRELGIRLRGKCRVFNSELRVKVPSSRAYVYPDVSVICGNTETQAGADDVVLNPKLVVEVLSPSTANYDRGKKFDMYREIPSFQEYLLCHQDGIRIEQFTRQADDSWVYRDHRDPDALLHLSSVMCDISLRDVYQDIVVNPA